MKDIILNKKIENFKLNINNNLKKDIISFYWSKKNPAVISNILNQFVEKNEIILDPFLGSAPILFSIDAHNTDLKFVGSEINEMPLSFVDFNTKNFSDNELQNIKKEFNNFFKKYKKFYEYHSPIYNEKICLKKIIFDCSDDKKINIKEFQLENASKSFSLKKNNPTKFLKNTKIYFKNFNYCKNKIKNIDLKLIHNSRIAVKKDMKLSIIFNPINFFILSEFSKKFEGNKVMMTILASILHLCRLTDLKSQSQFPYWVPKKNIVERNVLILINKKIEELIKKKINLNLNKIKNFKELCKKGKNILILNKPIQKITNNDIPNESVDILITDPPYYDQVAYSEYLKIWEYFCKFKTNFKDEIVVSNRMVDKKNLKEYLNHLTDAFTLINKKLKPNAIAIVFFKDSKPVNIHYFLCVMKNSGFNFVRCLHVGKSKFTYKQNTTPETTVTGDCLFFFKKDYQNKDKIDLNFLDKKYKIDKKEIKKEVKNFVQKYLEINTKPSLGELYDNGLIKVLFEKDLLYKINNSKIIVEILKEEFPNFR